MRGKTGGYLGERKRRGGDYEGTQVAAEQNCPQDQLMRRRHSVQLRRGAVPGRNVSISANPASAHVHDRHAATKRGCTYAH